jgi:hypothetical protein
MSRISTVVWLLAFSLAACRGDETVVQGTLADDVGVSRVWAVGGGQPAVVEADGFRIHGAPDGVLDLRFGDPEREVGRMSVHGLPAGSSLTLDGVWIDDNARAFPTSISISGPRVVTINETRWADAAHMPRDFDGALVVLAASSDGERLIGRPTDDQLPDLRVARSAATLVRTADGDPLDRLRLRAGDTIRVRGVTDAGIVVGHEIVVAREVARRR